MRQAERLVEIRRATVADASWLARMRANSALERHPGDDAAREAYERICARFFEAELAKADSFLRSWIALVDGAVAGSASLAISPTLPRFGAGFNGCDGRIRDVYTFPSFRRAGIAKALVLTAIDEARRLPVDRLTLGASDQGRPLYESLGFTAKSDEMVLDITAIPAVSQSDSRAL